MEIHRRLYSRRTFLGRRYYSFIRVSLEDEEISLANRYHLFGTRVDPSLLATVAPEIRAVMNRIRNRWDLVMVQTTGWVFLDLILLVLSVIWRVIFLLGRILFGTRVPFRDLGRGAIFSAGTISALHDKETHVFMRLAAIKRALEYGTFENAELELDAANLHAVIPGLTFAAMFGPDGQSGGIQDYLPDFANADPAGVEDADFDADDLEDGLDGVDAGDAGEMV